jgi:hypothetical protein
MLKLKISVAGANQPLLPHAAVQIHDRTPGLSYFCEYIRRDSGSTADNLSVTRRELLWQCQSPYRHGDAADSPNRWHSPAFSQSHAAEDPIARKMLSKGFGN